MRKIGENGLREIDKPVIYEIKLQGHLDESWSGWLADVNMITKKLTDCSIRTEITVDVPDQPALFGIIDRIRDLNLFLISVLEAGSIETNGQ